VLKRFLTAFAAFVGLIIPGSFGLALLAAPARPAPAPLDPPGCEQNLKSAGASVAAMQMRVQNSGRDVAQKCTLTRLYFLEVVKARAVTALCKNGADRDSELGRLDADVENINSSIASQCN
jgi:hypothetical protein